MVVRNMMRRSDRLTLLAEREAELEALRGNKWPRDVNDTFRWAGDAPHAARMCELEISYLRDLQARLDAGDPDLEGWER